MERYSQHEDVWVPLSWIDHAHVRLQWRESLVILSLMKNRWTTGEASSAGCANPNGCPGTFRFHLISSSNTRRKARHGRNCSNASSRQVVIRKGMWWVKTFCPSPVYLFLIPRWSYRHIYTVYIRIPNKPIMADILWFILNWSILMVDSFQAFWAFAPWRTSLLKKSSWRSPMKTSMPCLPKAASTRRKKWKKFWNGDRTHDEFKLTNKQLYNTKLKL